MRLKWHPCLLGVLAFAFVGCADPAESTVDPENGGDVPDNGDVVGADIVVAADDALIADVSDVSTVEDGSAEPDMGGVDVVVDSEPLDGGEDVESISDIFEDLGEDLTEGDTELSEDAQMEDVPTPSEDVEEETDCVPGVDCPQKKLIGYYSNWAQYRPAPRSFKPTNIDPQLYTHILYAFGDIRYDGNPGITATNFTLEPLEWNDISEWTIGVDWTDPQGMMIDVINLKDANPELEVLISLGGWNFNSTDWVPLLPHHQGVSTAWIFTTIMDSPEHRAGFIASILTFCDTYGFDGVDIDWEYPGLAPHNCVVETGVCEVDETGAFKDRVQDKENLPTFMAELREAADTMGWTDFRITMATGAGEPSTPYYDFPALEPSVDWIGMMTYDFHGAWDGVTGSMVPLGEDSSPAGSYCARCAVQLYACPPNGQQANTPAIAALCADFVHPVGGFNIHPDKLVMGMAAYGRGWSGVASAGMNIPATGASPPGGYTKAAGYLAYYEIIDWLNGGAPGGHAYETYWDANSSTPYLYSETAGVLVSYENAESLDAKAAFLLENELAGAMFWAMDLDLFLPDDVPQNELQWKIRNALDGID